MKTAKIVNADTDDYFIIEEDSVEQLRETALKGIRKRGWVNYYSIVNRAGFKGI